VVLAVTMFSGSSESAVYNLKLQTRCLAWVPVDEDNEADKQHLLVGTTSLREENEVGGALWAWPGLYSVRAVAVT